VNRFIIGLLCLTLCLAEFTVPTASAASRLTTSSKTALVSCLQREYLMRDVYQIIFAKYPSLTAFGAIAADEVAMIARLKKIFAKYRIVVPASTRISVAQTMANTVTSVLMADAVAINLEQSTAIVMTQLLQKTDGSDVLAVIALIKTASLGSHTSAFTAEQPSTSAPTPPPTIPTQRIVSFTSSQTAATLLALLRDETIDVIELSGTYRLPYTIVDIDRTRPVVVRPVAGATVVMSGANSRREPQFYFGRESKAGNITMQGLIFDDFVLGQVGIIHVSNAHDITLNDMIVRNSRANGTTALPNHAWAIYLTSTPTAQPTNFTANRWTIDGSARQMSALKVWGGSHVTATGWSVSNVYFAIYANSERGPLTDFILDDWTITASGTTTPGGLSDSVRIEDASGRFSNMHAIASGIMTNTGNPTMTDGGGNSW
jgi:hypothetical protein